MKYHIQIVKDGMKNAIQKFDLSKDIVEKKVTEYKSGDIFNLDGYPLKADQITRIKIVESEFTKEQILEKFYNSLPAGCIVVYTGENIFDDNKFVKDVTDSFLDN